MSSCSEAPAKKLQWAILGTSFISGVMVDAIRASDHGEVHSVAGRHEERLRLFAEKFSIGVTFTDYDALLRDPAVDVVYIGLPSLVHGEYCKRAAAAGKHILCEKSLTINTPQAVEAIECVRQSGVFLMEAQMYRCHPLMARLRQVVAEEKPLGEVVSINANFTARIIHLFNRAAGGSILDLGCYPISLMRLVAGEPVSMTGTSTLVPPVKDGENVFDQHSVAHVVLPGGVSACITACNDGEKLWEFHIVCERGVMSVTNLWDGDVQDAILLAPSDGSPPTSITVPTDPKKNFYAMQIDTVNGHIMNGDKQAAFPAMDWEDSLSNMRALDMWRAAVGLQYPCDNVDEKA